MKATWNVQQKRKWVITVMINGKPHEFVGKDHDQVLALAKRTQESMERAA